ncbi:BLUF domain-containing protein [Tateyamaria pelophila]|uniref:BLUF domain-containing protein n=1 Tax=Tateyamaria pelophila TaxID=328415 RepID=UPI001CBCE2FA|nr:BLUF domain-containing protein [Tateyamaria pelophila]
MTIINDLVQLVYVSQPFGYDAPMLSGILLDARRCNERDGITGALVCRNDVYLQLLEGPDAKVKEAYERIRRDDRHSDPRKLVNRPVHRRIFGNWAMLHDPAKSWIWSQAAISDGILDRATQTEILTLFENLAEKVRSEPPPHWRCNCNAKRLCCVNKNCGFLRNRRIAC